MTCTLEVLDPSGHVTLQWDPDDPESVARAEAEFKRMQEAGFAFFTTASPDAAAVKKMTKKQKARGSLDGRFIEEAEPAEALEQTTTFKPRRRRTVAVRQMAGG
jgi:hypothetical protein